MSVAETDRPKLALDTRERIMNAARARFEHYGFNKTTMAEIAQDCDMSAANIYRFFDNKSEIAAEGTVRWLAAAEEALSAVAARKTVSAAERLGGIVRTRLDLLSQLLARHPHLEELVADVCDQRPDLIRDHARNIGALIAGVLDDGVAAGDFESDDTAEAAATIQAATAMFTRHEFVRQAPVAELAQTAEKVVALLVRGLRKR
ncbi:MAG: helix-turn-helix domain-containing protein [Alphaproteobacteria bacterium]|jgi:AcrR family transcriptional regulator|nr:helix-turn-helix domain-containing protein [Alphaproteobacteria bacterium]MDP6516796.1 helix-turn-helix domain-containing protein [Alphaproteobacteria bacterium]|tara:strand:+ start:1052 stop:1663 length:612 start_codon:yes stop_codon:yes gene_type:complete